MSVCPVCRYRLGFCSQDCVKALQDNAAKAIGDEESVRPVEIMLEAQEAAKTAEESALEAACEASTLARQERLKARLEALKSYQNTDAIHDVPMLIDAFDMCWMRIVQNYPYPRCILPIGHALPCASSANAKHALEAVSVTPDVKWAENDLEAGDLVRLNSGGPKMTINALFVIGPEYTEAECAWFVHDEPRTQRFALEALVRAS